MDVQDKLSIAFGDLSAVRIRLQAAGGSLEVPPDRSFSMDEDPAVVEEYRENYREILDRQALLKDCENRASRAASLVAVILETWTILEIGDRQGLANRRYQLSEMARRG